MEKLNQHEKNIIDALLRDNFSGRNEIKAQIDTAKVRKCCTCGCNTIEFSITSNIANPTTHRVPVEAFYSIKGRPFEILLHVFDGKVSELEFVSYSDLIAFDYPKKEDLKIKVNQN